MIERPFSPELGKARKVTALAAGTGATALPAWTQTSGGTLTFKVRGTSDVLVTWGTGAITAPADGNEPNAYLLFGNTCEALSLPGEATHIALRSLSSDVDVYFWPGQGA